MKLDIMAKKWQKIWFSCAQMCPKDKKYKIKDEKTINLFGGNK